MLSVSGIFKCYVLTSEDQREKWRQNGQQYSDFKSNFYLLSVEESISPTPVLVDVGTYIAFHRGEREFRFFSKLQFCSHFHHRQYPWAWGSCQNVANGKFL